MWNLFGIPSFPEAKHVGLLLGGWFSRCSSTVLVGADVEARRSLLFACQRPFNVELRLQQYVTTQRRTPATQDVRVCDDVSEVFVDCRRDG